MPRFGEAQTNNQQTYDNSLQTQYNSETDEAKRLKLAIQIEKQNQAQTQPILEQNRSVRRFGSNITKEDVLNYQKAKEIQSQSSENIDQINTALAYQYPEQADQSYVNKVYEDAKSQLNDRKTQYSQEIKDLNDTINSQLDEANSSTNSQFRNNTYAYIRQLKGEVNVTQEKIDAVNEQLGKDKNTLVKDYYSGTASNQINERISNRQQEVNLSNFNYQPAPNTELGISQAVYNKLQEQGLLNEYIAKSQAEKSGLPVGSSLVYNDQGQATGYTYKGVSYSQEALEKNYERLQKVMPIEVYKNVLTGDLKTFNEIPTGFTNYFRGYATPQGKFLNTQEEVNQYLKENNIPTSTEPNEIKNIEDFKKSISPTYYEAKIPIAPVPIIQTLQEQFNELRNPDFIASDNKILETIREQALNQLGFRNYAQSGMVSLFTPLQALQKGISDIGLNIEKEFPNVYGTYGGALISEGSKLIPTDILGVGSWYLGGKAFELFPKITTGVLLGLGTKQTIQATTPEETAQGIITLGLGALGGKNILKNYLTEPIDKILIAPKDNKIALTTVKELNEQIKVGNFDIYSTYEPRKLVYDTRLNKFLRNISPIKNEEFFKNIDIRQKELLVSKARSDLIKATFISKDGELLGKYTYLRSTRPNEIILGRIQAESSDLNLQKPNKEQLELLKGLFEKVSPEEQVSSFNIKEKAFPEKFLDEDYIYQSANLEALDMFKLNKKTGEFEVLTEKEQLKAPEKISLEEKNRISLERKKLIELLKLNYPLGEKVLFEQYPSLKSKFIEKLGKQEQFELAMRSRNIETIGNEIASIKLPEKISENLIEGDIVGKKLGKLSEKGYSRRLIGKDIYLKDITKIERADLSELYDLEIPRGENIKVDKTLSEINRAGQELKLEIKQKPSEVFKDLINKLAQGKIELVSKADTMENKAISREISENIGKITPKVESLSIPINIQSLRDLGITKEELKNINKNTNKEISKEQSKEIQKEVQKNISKEISKEQSKEIQKEVQKNISKEISKETQKQIEKLIQKQIQKNIQKSILSDINMTLPETNRGKFFLQNKELQNILNSSQQKGYNIYIKEVKGNKFNKVNSEPLNKFDAQDEEAYLLDNSTARSGYIKQTSQKPSNKMIPIPSGYFEATEDKFRDFKVKKGKKEKIDGIIERSSYAIDTKGEKAHLSSFRLAQQLNRNTKEFKGTTKNKDVDFLLNL